VYKTQADGGLAVGIRGVEAVHDEVEPRHQVAAQVLRQPGAVDDEEVEVVDRRGRDLRLCHGVDAGDRHEGLRRRSLRDRVRALAAGDGDVMVVPQLDGRDVRRLGLHVDEDIGAVAARHQAEFALRRLEDSERSAGAGGHDRAIGVAAVAMASDPCADAAAVILLEVEDIRHASAVGERQLDLGARHEPEHLLGVEAGRAAARDDVARAGGIARGDRGRQRQELGRRGGDRVRPECGEGDESRDE
jgi:hypothetical protein